jgi:hypothetical protein
MKLKSIFISLALVSASFSHAMDAGDLDMLERGGVVAPSPAVKSNQLAVLLSLLVGSSAIAAWQHYWQPAAMPRGVGPHLVALGAANGKWVAAENGGGSHLVANRSLAKHWETFKMHCSDDTCAEVTLQADHGQWVSSIRGNVNAVMLNQDSATRFKLIDLKNGHVAFQMSDGKYLAFHKLGTSLYTGSGEMTENAQFVLKDMK